MKSNIVIIGFMGTGKTVVGELLSRKLGMKFLEMDTLIEQKAGKPIRRIFQEDGEVAFREMEIEVARQVAQEDNAVIACGGGVVLNQINIDRLKVKGRIVYLTASPEAILKRVADDGGNRPLLSQPDKNESIRQLLKFRQPFYERAAEIEINTSRLDIISVAGKIIEKLKEDAGFNFPGQN